MVDWWSFGILIFELLYGTTPFRGSRRDGTFDNVLKRPLTFPSTPQVSPEAKDLMKKLLEKVPGERIGATAGADEVKQHPWFDSVNWPLIRQQTPPYVPGRRSSICGIPPPPKAVSLPNTVAMGGGGGGGSSDQSLQPFRASAPADVPTPFGATTTTTTTSTTTADIPGF